MTPHTSAFDPAELAVKEFSNGHRNSLLVVYCLLLAWVLFAVWTHFTLRRIKAPPGKLQRWLKGGLWIHHSDDGWVSGRWRGELSEGWITDARGHGYHRTLVSITAIEEHPQWPRIVFWVPLVASRLVWIAVGVLITYIFKLMSA